MSAPMLPPDGGLLLVDKPAGCTSHDVVGRVRWLLGTRRVGHAGTLDPMATGLLVVAVERSTKLLGQLILTGKSYAATIRLGQSTGTDDAEGEVLESVDASGVTDAAVLAAIRALTGDILQVPSSVSAIKVDGRRSYERVRAGEEVALPARPVTVTRFGVRGPLRRQQHVIDLDVEVDCGSGTYIRALARDLGTALGVGGHLTALRRTAVGPFRVESAVDVYGPDGVPPRPAPQQRPSGPRPERARQERPADLVAVARAAIMPAVDAVRATFPTREVDETSAADIRHGRPIAAAGLPGTYAVLRDDRLLALVRESGGQARPELVWAPAG